jgi:hypothetical protein
VFWLTRSIWSDEEMQNGMISALNWRVLSGMNLNGRRSMNRMPLSNGGDGWTQRRPQRKVGQEFRWMRGGPLSKWGLRYRWRFVQR